MAKSRNVSGNCNSCGIWRDSLDKHHIVARRLGGTNDPSNLEYLCPNCHRDKTRQDKELQAQKSASMKEAWKRGAYAIHPMLGKRHSEVSRAKMSASRTGVKHTPEWNAKIGVAGIGRVHSPETRAKISVAHKGKPKSAEHRAKIAARIITAETRLKMSEAAKLRHEKGVYKDKSNQMVGKPHTAETKMKMSVSQSKRRLKEAEQDKEPHA